MELDQASVNANCKSGSNWDSGTGKCVKTDNCPVGYTYNNNGGNPVCGTASMPCTWASSDKSSVSCTPQFICPDGITEPNLKTSAGNQTRNPATLEFPWIEGDYQYEAYCPDSPTPKTITPALTKSYTHFISFNVSSQAVRKGTGINMNWIVEDPNDSCQIVGIDIRTKTVVFDTKNGEAKENALDKYIATSTNGYSSTRKNLAMGDYKTKIGDNSYWRVDQSTRFEATCTDSGNYKPGDYKVVKEVHVIGENE